MAYCGKVCHHVSFSSIIMPKQHELTAFQRGLIVGAHKALSSVRKVADLLKFPKSTVQDILQAYKNGQTSPLPCKGCPKKISDQTTMKISDPYPP